MDSKKYKQTYNDWVQKLPPKEREKLKAKGLDKPLEEKQNYSPDPEVAFANLGENFDYDSLDKSEEISDLSEINEMAKAHGSLLLCWVFQRLLSNSKKDELMLDMNALLFSLGMENLLETKTQTALAKRYGVTRASISFRVKSWQRFIGIKPSSLMKSESACKTYSKVRIANLTKKE